MSPQLGDFGGPAKPHMRPATRSMIFFVSHADASSASLITAETPRPLELSDQLAAARPSYLCLRMHSFEEAPLAV
jgi:hypothetical protein